MQGQGHVPCAGGCYTQRMPGGGDITELLRAWSGGDADALNALAPLVQHELRQMARRLLAGERTDRSWQATELINESFLRLLGWRAVEWQNRAQFYAATARMMRRVLVDAARARLSAKRGGGLIAESMDAVNPAAPAADVEIVALEEALTALATIDPRPSRVVELRFFGGFSVQETADALGVSVRTVINDWNAARAWLYRRLTMAGAIDEH